MMAWLFLILFVSVVWSSPLTHDDDPRVVGLKRIFFSLNGPSWAGLYARAPSQRRWFVSHNPCTWFGVLCEEDQYNITGLTLTNYNASGSWPADFAFFFPSLKLLKVSQNAIEGHIDASYFPSSLQALDFSHNKLDFFFFFNPPLCTQLPYLKSLRVAFNSIRSPFPSCLPPLLEELDLSQNFFFGPLPTLEVWPQNMHFFSVGFNQFNGSFPWSIFEIPSLVSLSCTNNAFSGALLDTKKNNSAVVSQRLQLVDLSFNQFSGIFPADFLLTLPKLFLLDASHNLFQGSLLTVLMARQKNFAENSAEISSFQISWLVSLRLSHNPHFDVTRGDDLMRLLLQQANNFFLTYTLDLDAVPLTPATQSYAVTFSDQDVRDYEDELFRCRPTQFVANEIVSRVYFPPFFWNNSISSTSHEGEDELLRKFNCACVEGTWGIPPRCTHCPDEVRCEADQMRLPPASYAVFKQQQDEEKDKKKLLISQSSGDDDDDVFLGLHECVIFQDGSSPCLAFNASYGHALQIQRHHQCAHGYEGRLCSECLCEDGDEENVCFFKRGDECVPCQPLPTYVLVIAIVLFVGFCLAFIFLQRSLWIVMLLEIVVLIILVALGIAEAYVMSAAMILVLVQAMELLAKSTKKNQQTEKKHFFTDLVSVEGMAKLLIWFLQATQLLIDTDFWPSSVQVIVSSLNFFNFRTSSIECSVWIQQFRGALGGGEVMKLVMVMIVPFALSVWMTLLLTLRFAWNKILMSIKQKKGRKEEEEEEEEKEEQQQTIPYHAIEGGDELVEQNHHHHHEEHGFLLHIRAMLIFIFYATLTEVTLVSFESVSCRTDDLTSLRWMESAPSVACSSTQYQLLQKLAWPTIVIWALGVPSLFFYLLFRVRHHLHHDARVEFVYGLLYENYRPRRWWWETVWMLRRVLVAFSVALGQSTFFLTSSTLLGSMVLQHVARPFEKRAENTLELATTAVLLVTWSCAIEKDGAGISEWQRVVVAVLNLVWLLVLVALTFAPPLITLLQKAKYACQRKKNKNHHYHHNDQSLNEVN